MSTAPHSFAVFVPNWVGDAIMATPALRAIRERYAESEITAVMRPVISPTLAGLDLYDHELLHDPRGSVREHRSFAVIRELRRRRPDSVVLFTNSLRSGVMAWLSGAKDRVGYARDGRGWTLTERLQPLPKSTPHPALDAYLKIAEVIGCENISHRMELTFDDDDREQLDRFWTNHPGIPRDRMTVINPGGAFGAAKHWPAEHFGKLARRIVTETDRTVLVLCGPSEREIARQIVAVADHERVVSLADGPLSIGLSKAAVAEAESMITTDSGPRHFAGAFDVPVLTIFGPTHIAWSETSLPLARHVQLPVDCGPCQQRVCPLGHHRCMTELTPERVFAEFLKLPSNNSRSRKIA